MVAVNATLSSHTTGGFESPMASVPHPNTILNTTLLTTTNGSDKEGCGFGRAARSYSSQPKAPRCETSIALKSEAENLLQRVQNYFTSETALGEFVTEWTPGTKANTHRASLDKDILCFIVKFMLVAEGVYTEDLREAIGGLAEKMLAAPAALDFARVVKALVEKILRGHETPKAVIERFPVKDYVRAAEHQQVVPLEPTSRQQTMKCLVGLLGLYVKQPMHRADKPMAALQISHPIGHVVHNGSAAPVSEDSHLSLGSGLMCKTSVSEPQAAGFRGYGAMASEMSLECGESESAGFLGDVPSTVLSFFAGGFVGAAQNILKSPRAIATAAVAGGTTASLALYGVYKLASPPPASDAAPDVTPPAVTDVAREPDGQQSGNGTSKTEDFHHDARPNTGYKYSESAEEESRRLDNSELPDLKHHPKKTAPPHPPSQEKD